MAIHVSPIAEPAQAQQPACEAEAQKQAREPRGALGAFAKILAGLLGRGEGKGAAHSAGEQGPAPGEAEQGFLALEALADGGAPDGAEASALSAAEAGLSIGAIHEQEKGILGGIAAASGGAPQPGAAHADGGHGPGDGARFAAQAGGAYGPGAPAAQEAAQKAARQAAEAGARLAAQDAAQKAAQPAGGAADAAAPEAAQQAAPEAAKLAAQSGAAGAAAARQGESGAAKGPVQGQGQGQGAAGALAAAGGEKAGAGKAAEGMAEQVEGSAAARRRSLIAQARELRGQAAQAEASYSAGSGASEPRAALDGAGREAVLEVRMPAHAATSSASSAWESRPAQALESMLARELHQHLNGDIVRQASLILREGGEGIIRLALRPESLGNVKIRLEMADNKITGYIVVESEEALRAFEREMASLEKEFRDAGFEGAELKMSMSGGGADGQSADGDGGAFIPASLAASRYDAAAEMTETIQSEAGILQGAGAVDMLA